MSQTKKYKFQILFILMMVCFFMFGCKNETPVENISFNIDSGNQIVLIVGQTLKMDDYVSVYPSYATNKKYTLTSFNEDLVKVDNNSLVALKEGNVLVKVVSNDNALKEDMMTVVVKSSQEQLLAPINLAYDNQTQTFSFDPVLYASSYTLKINGQEFDLGNTTLFDMSQYAGERFDSLIIAQVKANAPEYSFALTTSDYSNEIKVYQAGAVKNLRIEGGIVKFDKYSANNVHNVYLNNAVIARNLTENYISVKELSETYAGQSLTCKVEAVVSDDVKSALGTDTQYFNSTASTVGLKVLDVPNLSLSASQLSWQNVAHADGYDIIVDDIKKAETQNNYFELKDLSGYDDIITSSNVHEIKVLPKLSTSGLGIGQSVLESSISVQRLANATIICDGTDLKWNEIENASVYSISLIGEQVDFKSSTSQNSLSMANYLAGQYSFSVTAIANEIPNDDGVYFLSSKTIVKEFKKHEILAADIENYVLNISNLGDDKCEIRIDDDPTAYEEKLEENKLRLIVFDFTAKTHNIYLKRLGDENHIDSDVFVRSFTQLEKIEEITISNYVARVTRSEINQNATIKLVTTGSKIEAQTNFGTSFNYNSEIEGENYLPAGDDYVTKVYVEGDGSSTFSYRENGVVVSCCEVSFEVLSAPTKDSFAVDKETGVMTFGNTANKFKLYEIGSTAKDLNENSYPIDLFSGSVSYQVQAIGDGEKTLNSIKSDIITITRLETPPLYYNNTNNVISMSDEYDNSNVSVYEFTHNDKIITNYDFGNKEFVLEDETIGNVFTLKALAKDRNGNTFYLNSPKFVLTLNQISNKIETIEVQGLDNILVIKPENHSEEFELKVEFTFETESQTFASKIDEASGEKVLYNNANQLSLPYYFSNENGAYYINLVNDEHNAIVQNMNGEFAARVQFIKTSTGNDSLINSNFSESATLNLNRIDATTNIAVNSNNQIVLTPNAHNQQFGLVGVVMVSDNFGYMVASNGEGKLVCDKYIQIQNGVEQVGSIPTPVELNYAFKNNAYYVDIFNENQELLIPGLSSYFEIKVKYSFNHNGIQSDLDSDYCELKTIEVQIASEIERDGQNIKIKNIKDTYTYTNYSLLINNYPILLDDTAISVDGYIVFDVEYIYSHVNANNYIQNENVIEVITRVDLTGETPIIATKGGSMTIAKTDTITLSNYKYNNNEDGKNNNSTVVEFETYETSYYKKYTIEITNDGQKVYSKDFEDASAVDGVISINLDELSELSSVSGNVIVSGYVQTSGVNNSIEMFNSVTSNSLFINKLNAPSNLYVQNSTLHFDADVNAVGYEVYEKTGTGYVKLNSQLLTTNSFNISNMTGVKQLVVKAISKTGNYSNSSYSQTITINKIATPTVSVVNGKFNISFSLTLIQLLLNENVTITPIISNGTSNNVTIDLKNLDGEDLKMVGLTTLEAEPYLFMAYNNATLMPENLTLSISITQNGDIDGVYYVNPDNVSLDCYGLFEPSNLKKTTNENDSVEIISWTASNKNVLNTNEISVGYILKVEYNNGTEIIPYYSDDLNLKYYDENTGEYVSYASSTSPYITGTSAIFPAGYGLNDDGTLSVKFGAGAYKVSVQAVPLSNIDGYNICSSKYSTCSEFEIMQSALLSVDQGKLVWEANPKASHYVVSIYEQNGTEPVFVDEVKSAEYDFTNTNLNGYTGVYKVDVKSISSREDTLNSAKSAAVYVYRLPQAYSATVDDGNLILSSTAFFQELVVELVDFEGVAQTLPTYINASLPANMTLLKVDGQVIKDWSSFTDEATVNNARKFSIDLNNVINIYGGRDYKINVKLVGNTSDSLGFISSVKTVNLSSLKATKLKANAVNVNLGVVQFMPDNNYATISSDGVYTPTNDLKYEFNGMSLAETSEFWSQTVVYKIVLTTAGGSTPIYAVDYYSLKTAINNNKISASEYELTNGEYGLYAWVKYAYQDGTSTKYLYFHVFQDNKINLRDYEKLIHYSMQETMSAGVNTFSCETVTKDITLTGTITVDIYMMGGDSAVVDSKLIGYLTAKSNDLTPFECYATNTLSSFKGKVQFNNQTPIVDGVTVDNPIYKIIVSLINSQTPENSKVFYIYQTTEADARSIATRFDNIDYTTEENLLKATFIQATVNEKNSALLFDLSNYFVAGTYEVSIKTLAGLGNGTVDIDDYFINSRAEGKQTFQKLTDTNFYVNDGVLEFERSYVVSDGRQVPYDDYEITLIETSSGKEYVYDIGADTEGVSIDVTNNVTNYILPEIYGGGKEYKIKIRAIAKDNLILNGTYKQENAEDVALTFEKSLGLSETSSNKLKIENGILKWKVLDLENYKATVIRVSFLDKNKKTKTAEFTVEDLTRYEIDGVYQYHYYEFTDGTYDFITGGSTYLESEITYEGETTPSTIIYSITAFTKGTVTETKNILNSNLSSVCTTTRLNSITGSEIKTVDGVLTWTAIKNAVSYQVIFTGENDYTFTTTQNTINLLKEDYQILAGEYDLQIKAIGSSNINSMLTNPKAEGFIQLDVVSSIELQESNIDWPAVENAKAYKVVFEYTNTAGLVQTITDDNVTETYYTAPNDIGGEFKITISAIGKGEGKEFNGKATTFSINTAPPVQVDSFTFEKENGRFVIEKQGDFSSGDKLVIVYDFEEYTDDQQTKAAATTETITINMVDGVSMYYYPISKMGEYTKISVRVTRSGTIPSNTVTIKDFEFDLFSYGDGSTTNPYRIYEAKHLLNIAYFTSANYVLTSSINMATVDVQARLATYGAIICDEFTGTLDGGIYDANGYTGGNFSILGFNVDGTTDTIVLENTENFALFNNLNGAEIKNLTIGSENIQLILLNTFAKNVENVVNLSLIATGAQNSTTRNWLIENVNVRNFKIVINSQDLGQLSGNVYVSGLVGKSTGGAIKNSIVNAVVEINIKFTSDLYAGGVIAFATETNVQGSTLTFTLSTGEKYADCVINYLGGAIGYYEGNQDRTTGIYGCSNVTINFENVNSLYSGGLVGFARNVTISASSTKGSYTRKNISSAVRVGGLVGSAQNSAILNSGTEIVFDISVTSADTEKRFGAIAGELTNSCEVNACYMSLTYQEMTDVTISAITLGIYGYKDTTITITGCYQKINQET